MKLQVKTDARVRLNLGQIVDSGREGVYRCITNPDYFVVSNGRTLIGFNGSGLVNELALAQREAQFEALPAGTRITVEFTA